MPRQVISTYRLQLHAGFRFEDAWKIVGYLASLGVSHVYASPYLRAAKGSTHGYDLVDPSQVNPEIGTLEELRALDAELAAHGMGHLLDFVPNHMGIAGGENAWWEDVLENGPSSCYADRFDVEWDPPKTGMKDKILLPILGAQYGEALEKGDLAVVRDGGAFFVRYFDRRLPLSPPTTAPLLDDAVTRLTFGADDRRTHELSSVAAQLHHMPASDRRDPALREERAREKEVAKRRLAKLCRAEPEIAAALDAAVAAVNADPDKKDELLGGQSYRPSFWRVATEEINYRRFFEINDLAAVRMEDDIVFEEMHRLPFLLMEEGRLDGLRLDHIDGLYDPAEYLAKIRARVPEGSYLVAEKILEPGERLPAWPIEGTTGYDFVAAVSGLFVDGASKAAMTALYKDVTGDDNAFSEHAYQAKRAIMRGSLSAEIHVLSHMLERIALADRRSRDFTLASLTTAIVETIAAFPVYRTYIRPDGAREKADEDHVRGAVRAATRRKPEMSTTVFDFLRNVLLMEPGEDRPTRVRFAMRFQQTTGPVMAKALEDTAFYTYVRLASLNEVGGRPDEYGVSVGSFHAGNARRRELFPRAMTAVSTHDTKRGEDVRARLAVLSEMPDEWRQRVASLRERAKKYAAFVDEDPAPSGGDEYLFHQTVIGALPFDARAPLGDFVERVSAYMVKAAREGKRRTSWLNPDDAYERALDGFVRGSLGDSGFVEEARALVSRIGTYAASNGLALKLLQIASPGVPDTFQGTETWNLSLVDPDNRRTVDYRALADQLASLDAAPREGLAARLLETYHDGRVKHFVARAALALRRRHPSLFVDGDYTPLDSGEHVVAFARRCEGKTAVCAAARLPYRLTRGEVRWAIGDRVWKGVEVPLPPGRYEDVLTGRRLDAPAGASASLLFAELPVALLFSETSS